MVQVSMDLETKLSKHNVRQLADSEGYQETTVPLKDARPPLQPR